MKKSATKRSGKGSIKKEQIIVLMDGAGNYYELGRETLEKSRVSEDRKKEVAALLEDEPIEFRYIPATAIPGSIAARKFEGGRRLRYAGFYIKSKP